PIAFVAALGVRQGFGDWERLALLAAWVLPILSRGLGAAIGVQFAPLVLAAILLVLLRRVRATAAQSGLPLLRRHANLSGAMRATRPCAGAHIVLVDDVMTTGATLSACAAVLKDAGAAAVINLVVARTD
ncbi:MAG TPA: phosphoribosyltransferase family protein, partial [Quisquiliibacterium sp.]|nr:phosphoribosyltransferase family protein [Quisquiliibacterium sp.]